MNEPESKPAPSEDMVDRMFTGNLPPEECISNEDEGEKRGKRLYEIACRSGMAFLDKWEDLLLPARTIWVKIALRFRAECVKPYERLVEAARVVCNQVTGRDGLADEVCGLSVPPPLFPKPAHDAFAGERSDTDEPPKPTSRVAESIEDHELGRYAQDTLHMYLGESVSICLRADNLREYGAAIRAKLKECVT